MDFIYAVTPFFAWLVAGCLKFAVNSVRAKRLALDLIGYGGMPSNHSAIVSSTAALIALREGIGHPAFGVAVTLAFIVMLDAHSLRRQVGKQAQAINALARRVCSDKDDVPLRERMGHSVYEIGAGVLTGMVVALAMQLLFTRE